MTTEYTKENGGRMIDVSYEIDTGMPIGLLLALTYSTDFISKTIYTKETLN